MSRRTFLGNLATGLGSIALASLLAEEAHGQTPSPGGGRGGGKAKRVIQ
ncbi:twin-arginine translocation signal domain-containing protein, partial [Armatimonas sp.]